MRKAPATDRGRAAATLVLCGHGTRGEGGVLDRHAGMIREQGDFAGVRVCSLYAEPKLEAVLDTTDATDICVVPWLMCAGYTMDRMAERIARHPLADRIRLAEPVGSLPGIADLASDIAEQACLDRGWQPTRTGLLVIGHGSERNSVSAETTRHHAARIAASGVFAEVATAFLDEPPSPAEALARLDAPHCVAIGLFAERSLHGEDDVPRLLGKGRSVAYAGPIGTAPAFADVIVARAISAQEAASRSAA